MVLLASLDSDSASATSVPESQQICYFSTPPCRLWLSVPSSVPSSRRFLHRPEPKLQND